MTASDASSSSSELTGDGSSVSTAEARDRLEQHVRDIERTYDDTRARIEDINERAVDFIRENPGVCILGAVTTGFIIGRLASRRWLT